MEFTEIKYSKTVEGNFEASLILNNVVVAHITFPTEGLAKEYVDFKQKLKSHADALIAEVTANLTRSEEVKKTATKDTPKETLASKIKSEAAAATKKVKEEIATVVTKVEEEVASEVETIVVERQKHIDTTAKVGTDTIIDTSAKVGKDTIIDTSAKAVFPE